MVVCFGNVMDRANLVHSFASFEDELWLDGATFHVAFVFLLTKRLIDRLELVYGFGIHTRSPLDFASAIDQ